MTGPGRVVELPSTGRWRYAVQLNKEAVEFRRLLGEVRWKAGQRLGHGGTVGQFDAETTLWLFRAEALPWLTEWGGRHRLTMPAGLVDWSATIAGWREDHHPGGPRYGLHTAAQAWLAEFERAGGVEERGRWLFTDGPALRQLVARIRATGGVEFRREELDRAALLSRGYVDPAVVVVEERAGWVAFAGEPGWKARLYQSPRGCPYEAGDPGWRVPACFAAIAARSWTDVDTGPLAAAARAVPRADAYVVAAGSNARQVKVWTLRTAFRSGTHGPQPPAWGAQIVDADRLHRWLADAGLERAEFSPWLAESRWIDRPDAYGTIRLRPDGLAIEQAVSLGSGEPGVERETGRDRSTVDWVGGRWVVTLPFTGSFVKAGAELLAAGGEQLPGGGWRLGPDWPTLRFVRELLHLLAPSDATETAAAEIGGALDLDRRVEELRPRVEHLARSDGKDLDRAGWPDVAMPFQVATMRHIVAGDGSLVADQPGTGKSLSALAALDRAGAFPAVIVCPAGLRGNWQREIQKWYPGRSFEVLTGVKPSVPPRADLYVVGWDTLYAWVDALKGLGLRAAIADEARFGKNLRSRRGAAGLDLFQCIPDDGVRAVLDATPVEHRLSDLWMLLVMLRMHEIAGPDRATFARRWSGHVDELHRVLFQTCMVRHLKRDVLDQLPPKLPLETVVTEPKGPAWDAYWGDQDDTMAFITGTDLRDNRNRLKARGMLASLRKQVGVAKMGDVIPIVDRWLDQIEADPDARLLVWTHHRDVTEGLARAFRAPMIIGGMSDRARFAQIDRWAGPDGARVLVASMKSAGFGLTLHLDGRCSDQVFAEVPESGAQFEQAEDRLDRIGQTHGVQTTMVLSAGTTDAMYYRACVGKTVLADRAIDGRVRSIDPDRAAALIEQLYSWGDGDASDEEEAA